MSLNKQNEKSGKQLFYELLTFKTVVARIKSYLSCLFVWFRGSCLLWIVFVFPAGC